MKKNIIHSSVFKIGALLFTISFMAVISMFSSVFKSDGAQDSAPKLNIAGALRTKNYRILAAIQLQDVQKSATSRLDVPATSIDLEHDLTKGILFESGYEIFKLIARELNISDGTVKVHVKHFLKKLNLRSRVEAAVWMINHQKGG